MRGREWRESESLLIPAIEWKSVNSESNVNCHGGRGGAWRLREGGQLAFACAFASLGILVRANERKIRGRGSFFSSRTSAYFELGAFSWRRTIFKHCDATATFCGKQNRLSFVLWMSTVRRHHPPPRRRTHVSPRRAPFKKPRDGWLAG